VIFTLCILAFIAGLYLSTTYINPIRQVIFPDEVNNQESDEIVQTINTNSVYENRPEETTTPSADSRPARFESSIYDELHRMINTKIVADQIWGKIEITEEKVNALIKEVSSSNYHDKEILLEMLYNWKKGDFSNAVKEHNYL
jgi:hypothetical protein